MSPSIWLEIRSTCCGPLTWAKIGCSNCMMHKSAPWRKEAPCGARNRWRLSMIFLDLLIFLDSSLKSILIQVSGRKYSPESYMFSWLNQSMKEEDVQLYHQYSYISCSNTMFNTITIREAPLSETRWIFGKFPKDQEYMAIIERPVSWNVN